MRAVVSGTGEMGRLVLATLEAEPSVEVVGVLEPLLGTAAAPQELDRFASDYPLQADPQALFEQARPDLVVDFTNARRRPGSSTRCSRAACAR